jgi:pimeloyl-ACP methyl ester carboxylesterase
LRGGERRFSFQHCDRNSERITQIMQRIRHPDYARVQAPALALYALADHWTPEYAAHCASRREFFARALPRAQVVAVPHSTHYLFLRDQERVLREIRTFLSALGE